MFNLKFVVDSYADFKTAVAAFGDPGSVFYRFLNEDTTLAVWAVVNGHWIGTSGLNSDTPSEGTFLTDFPAAHEMTASFSPQ